VETVAGQARTLDYTYDDAGRLQDVKENGTLVERHRYDLAATTSRCSTAPTPPPAGIGGGAKGGIKACACW
jgi:hypothetical protein